MLLRRRMMMAAMSLPTPYGVYGLNTQGQLFEHVNDFTGTPQGIYVHSATASQPRIFWPEQVRRQWAVSFSHIYDIAGVPVTSDITTAKTDFSGKENTQIIVAAKGANAPAANDIFTGFSQGVVPVGCWYMPAVGEWEMVKHNYSSGPAQFPDWARFFNPSFKTGTDMGNWTSTQYDEGGVWGAVFYAENNASYLAYKRTSKYTYLGSAGYRNACCLWEDFIKRL